VFISDYADRAIYQRNLSTAFDVSSVTGSQTSLFLGSIYPNSLSFNNDGTKLYVLEYNAVKEYALTTAFDVTSGSLSATESLSSQESAMQGLTFNNDGTKMFTVGDSGNRVYEYALSSAFDISSLSYTDNLSIQPQESNPQEIKFNHDGTKMYISGYSGDDINEYTLSSAFDISSTVTHKGVYSVSSSDGSSGAYGFSFNNDGTKLFTTGTLQDRVNEHSLTTPFSLVDVSGEHSGDVINTSSTDNYDTDPDSDTLTVTAIRTGSVEDSGTAGSVGSALTGSYGQLTIAANGSYTYVVADNSTMDALDAGDIVTDTFNYTVSDGQGETDIATITITITGINDAPVADNETGSVNISQTLTVTDGSSDLLDGDTDADGSASLRVSSIVATTASGSATAVNLGTAYNSGYTSVSGSYGTLRIGADGTYQYIAGSSAGTDVFTYTLSDGTATDTATLTITVNTVPVARNDVGHVAEDGTLQVDNGDNANVSGSYDAAGEHSGDVLQTSSGTHQDTDANSDTLTVTAIRTGSVEGSGTAGSVGSALTGSYGQLTIAANGSYTYIANQSAADALDVGDTVTDVFNYTVSDGNSGTDIATITITIHGANDVPVADNETGSVLTGHTLTVTDGSSDLLDGDTDADTSASLSVSSIVATTASGSATAVNSGTAYNSGYTSVAGSYGTLRVGADGTYQYIAGSNNGTDVFTYTLSDGTATDTATLTITVAPNSAPSATNDTDAVNEDATITESSGSKLLVADDTGCEQRYFNRYTNCSNRWRK
jgi:VCBS repeat-containing protein